MAVVQDQAVKILRYLGFAEAFSWLLLLFIAMPLKYLAGKPLFVTYVGWFHGILFMAYIAQLVYVKFKYDLSFSTVLKGLVAAFFPFGTLVFDKSLKNLGTRVIQTENQ